MPQVISLRVPDATAERLRAAARRAGRSLNEWGALSLEEWLRQNEFADIEFRSGGGERHVCLKGALPLWQVVMVAQSYDLDAGRTAQHFGWPIRRIQAALNYYEAFTAEINEAIEDNHRVTETSLRRLLPQMETLLVPASSQTTDDSGEEGANYGKEGLSGS